MIIALNIGNSHIAIGLMEGEKARFIEYADTHLEKTDLEYAIDIMAALKKHNVSPSDVSGGIISSAVPAITIILATAVTRVFSFAPYVISGRKQNYVKVCLDNPTSLGGNLLADAACIKKHYPLPAILIDMGTATSIGVLNPDGDYIGGALLPGMAASFKALTKKTSTLPDLRITGSETLLAKETSVCINTGAIYGTQSTLDGMIDRIFAELQEEYPEIQKEALSIVMTGRLSALVLPHMKHKVVYDPLLTMKGLSVLYDDRKGGESK